MSKEVKYPGDDPMSYLGLTPGTPEWEEVSRRREYAMDTDEELLFDSEEPDVLKTEWEYIRDTQYEIDLRKSSYADDWGAAEDALMEHNGGRF